jgi:hypothetical protein
MEIIMIPQQQAGCSIPFSFLEIELQRLPELWWMILRSCINDYLQFDCEDQRHKDARQWLFLENYDPMLDGEKGTDVVSLYTISKGFGLDIDVLRFKIQCLRDSAEVEKCDGSYFRSDLRGRKVGYLHNYGLNRLLIACSCLEELPEVIGPFVDLE